MIFYFFFDILVKQVIVHKHIKIKIDMREWLSGRALPCLRNWKANNYYQQNKQNSYSPYHFPDKSTRTLYTKNLIKQIKQRHAGVAQW